MTPSPAPDDIVGRLRKEAEWEGGTGLSYLAEQAADEITRLRAEKADLEARLVKAEAERSALDRSLNVHVAAADAFHERAQAAEARLKQAGEVLKISHMAATAFEAWGAENIADEIVPLGLALAMIDARQKREAVLAAIQGETDEQA